MKRNRDRIIRRAIETLRRHRQVRGLWLAGSLAEGTENRYSDIDLHIGVSDCAVRSIYARGREFAADIGQVLACYDRERILDHIVLYKGFVRVEFVYCSIDRLEPRPDRRGAIRVLYDPDGAVHDYQRRNNQHTPVTAIIAADLEDRGSS